MLSSNSFVFSYLLLNSFIHFELLFACGMKSDPISFSASGKQVSPILFVEKTALSLLCAFDTFLKDRLNINAWVYFRSIGLYVCFYASTMLFGYNSFAVYFEIRKCDASSFALPVKTALAMQGLLRFHMNFRIVCSISVKNTTGLLIGITLNVQITLGNMDDLNRPILTLPVSEHET